MAKDEETVTLSYSDRFRDKMKDDFDEKEDCEYWLLSFIAFYFLALVFQVITAVELGVFKDSGWDKYVLEMKLVGVNQVERLL